MVKGDVTRKRKRGRVTQVVATVYLHRLMERRFVSIFVFALSLIPPSRSASFVGIIPPAVVLSVISLIDLRRSRAIVVPIIGLPVVVP